MPMPHQTVVPPVPLYGCSNRRANSEMASWLEQHEKQSELLGGAGDVLANSQSDPI